MKKIPVRCPTCNQMGYIEINDIDLQPNIRGIMGVNVLASVICEHAFVVYIDNNHEIRDCFSTDFTIHLPELELGERNGNNEQIDLENINVDLITTNILSLTIVNILHACFLKRKLLFLSDDGEINLHLNNFVNFCFQDSFDIFFEAKQRWEYGREEENYKEYIIIENERVIKDEENILSPKKIKIERVMVQTFLAEPEQKTSLVLLKNEIKIAFHLAKHSYKFFLSKGGLESRPKDLIKYLDKKSTISINRYYLKFIIQILINYFDLNLKEKLDFTGYIDWAWFLE